MKQKCYYAGILIVAVCFFCTWAQAIDLTLTYERYPDHNPDKPWEFRPYGRSRIEFARHVPEGEWKLPERNSKIPLYGWIKLGDQERLVILDKSGNEAEFYDRLYFDANANRDLTDDKVIEAENVESWGSGRTHTTFPRQDILSLVDSVSMPYSFIIYLSYYGNPRTESSTWWGSITSFFKGTSKQEKPLDLNQLYSSISTQCMYEAELEQGGTTYKLWLADYNGNGRFDDLGKKVEVDEQDMEDPVWAQGDALYLAPVGANMGYSELQFLGKYLHLKDTLYTVAIAQAEKRLTLTPVTEGIARIELPMPVHRIVLMSDDGWVMSCMPEKTVLVPSGSYQLLRYVLFHDEPTGARWRLWATASGNSPVVTVPAGGSADYVIGEPFRPVVTVPKRYRVMFAAMNQAMLDMTVVGAGKELVQELVCIDNREKSSVALSQKEEQKPKEATYKILKPDGEVVTQGSFEYG